MRTATDEIDGEPAITSRAGAFSELREILVVETPFSHRLDVATF